MKIKKLYIVGIGPGSLDDLSVRAKLAISKSTAIVGYKSYIETISPLLKNQKVYSYPMSKEIDRCKKAIELARQGEAVSLVSSGDPGIYGMAGLALELLSNSDANKIDISVIPGISALNISAALLGAPLMNDFAVISLSDILTPWEIIEERIKAASKGNFVIVLYNPGSKKRVEHLRKAFSIVLSFQPHNTPVGIVEKKTNGTYKVEITTIENLMEKKVNMNTTVIVGNSQTFVKNGKMITKRGYRV